MNKTLQKIGGIVAIFIGSKFILDALFYTESDVMNSVEDSIDKAMFLVI